jgi:glutamate N-acetyltransferase / amino-acid N-acetyltransferase
MKHMEIIPDGTVTAPAGFRAGGIHSGIKKDGKTLDLCLLVSDQDCSVAGVYTQNKVRAAPILVCLDHERDGRARAVVINSGCANACTGERGLADAYEMTRLVGQRLEIPASDVMVASTGVIGVHLPMARIRDGISAITLSSDGGHDAARAIMTTDTRPKESCARVSVGGRTITVGGMAKGSGMIHPNMATMIAVITTDAAVDQQFLATVLRDATDASFNQMTVDGDTSTNDTLLILANGVAGNDPLTAESRDAEAFSEAVTYVAAELAKAVARDGEGATKFIEVIVRGALTRDDARRAAKAVASSSLVKTAVYGNDPNWGRILCAIGYSGAEVDPGRVELQVGNLTLMRAGEPIPFERSVGVEQLDRAEVSIAVDLHLGDQTGLAWGCDLTEGYIDINAKYTT